MNNLHPVMRAALAPFAPPPLHQTMRAAEFREAILTRTDDVLVEMVETMSYSNTDWNAMRAIAAAANAGHPGAMQVVDQMVEAYRMRNE